MRLGIFGGTFNPIHFGHLRTAEEVRYKLDFDKIIFIPSGNPPIKSTDLTDAVHRHEMTRLATGPNINFAVSDVELDQAEKSYTVSTLQKLHEIYPRDELFFILGIDAFLDLPKWRQPEVLTGLIDFVVISRPGFNFADIARSPYIKDSNKLSVTSNKLIGKNNKSSNSSLVARHLSLELKGGRHAILVDVTPLGISSTEIRLLVRESRSIGYLLPEAVEKYICSHNLYRQTGI